MSRTAPREMADRPQEQTAHSFSERRATRPLEGIERALRVVDSVRPLNLVAVVRLSGNIPAARLRAALDATQARHPLLRCRIRRAGNDEVFEFDGVSPIPLDIAARHDREQWMAVAREELHRWFDVAAGPLLRCRYLEDREGGDLVLASHHTIVDARSTAGLLHELLARCAGREVEPADDTADEGRYPARALYPQAFRGVRLAAAAVGYLGRQLADETAFRWQARSQRKPPVVMDSRSGILSMAFAPPVTSAIVQASRRERVTLNAALGAALMIAVQRQIYRTTRGSLRHITFADLRPRLIREVPDGVLGCMMTMLRFTLRVEQHRGTWALAREIQDATNRAVRSGDRYLTDYLSPLAMKAVFSQRKDRLTATALSYMGPLALPAKWGGLEVLGLHAFTTALPHGPEFSALARIFRSELCCDFQHLDSDLDTDGAQRIADQFRAILEEAAC